MSDDVLKRITAEFSENVTEITDKLVNILDLFEEHLTNHKLSYFYKKDVHSKQERKDYVFSRSDIMHLLGIKAYKINSLSEIKTVSKDKITVTNAERFYSDYLSNNINWNNVWIDSSEYLIQKLDALTWLPNLKEYGVQIGDYLILKNFEVDSFLKSKNTLALGFYSENDEPSHLITYHPRTSLNLSTRPNLTQVYKVTKIIDYKINRTGIYEHINTYNFSANIQKENSKKKQKRNYKKRRK